METISEWAALVAFPLAICILISGLDDLLVDLIFFFSRRPESRAQAAAEQTLAVFVPLWHEHAVIGRMVEHNIGAIRFANCHFFLGSYPNDRLTCQAVEELEARFPRVHGALCPHDGPTSKADCLNWIYQRMLIWEEQTGVRIDAVVIHDAEDLIHPESLPIINAYLGDYDMIQVPVLPLPTPAGHLTHGVYCDEFAEYLTINMPARQAAGGFLPSNGVGTGFSRRALDRVAEAEQNRIFEPSCLTEDYEAGFRLKELGCQQIFIPIQITGGQPAATREYFPRSAYKAIRQRTRWVTGIVMQGWELHGWTGGWRQLYWHWRDRKGLLVHPAGLISNLLFLAGVITWIGSRLADTPWTFGAMMADSIERLLPATAALVLWRTAIRMACVARIYGLVFALAVPVRTMWANWINSAACLCAVILYARARLKHQPLRWIKTEHRYPSREALTEHRRALADILVQSEYVTAADLSRAYGTKPPGKRLGEHLVDLGLITEEDLYEALSLQQGLPVGVLRYDDAPPEIWRALPAHIIHQWRVVPFKIESGKLFIAGPEAPSDDLERALRRFTQLEIRFQLITPANYEELSHRVFS